MHKRNNETFFISASTNSIIIGVPIIMIDADKIKPKPNDKVDWDKNELLNDIKENGQRIPLWVRRKNEEDYEWEILEGVHRFNVMQDLNIKKIKCQNTTGIYVKIL